MKKPSKKYTHTGLFLFIIVSLALFLVFFILNQLGAFRIKDVFVNHVKVSEQLKNNLLKDQHNQNLYALDFYALKKNVERYYLVEEIHIKKSYPHTLFIDIMYTNILAYLKIPGTTEKLFGVNQQGKIIRVLDRSIAESVISEYPVFLLDQDMHARQWSYSAVEAFLQKSMGPSLQTLVSLKSLDEKSYKKIQYIRVHSNPLKNELMIRDLPTRVYFGEHLTMKDLLYILALEDDLKNKTSFRSLDLRFETIIARY